MSLSKSRSFFGKLWDAWKSKNQVQETFVGQDSSGRKYYETHYLDGRRASRRYFVKEEQIGNDIGGILDDKLPPAWSQWIRKTRKDPPLDVPEPKEIREQFIMDDRYKLKKRQS